MGAFLFEMGFDNIWCVLCNGLQNCSRVMWIHYLFIQYVELSNWHDSRSFCMPADGIKDQKVPDMANVFKA